MTTLKALALYGLLIAIFLAVSMLEVPH